MEKTNERRKLLQCTLHPLGALEHYKYVVICARFDGKWLLSRHKKRDTWETQGGHIEPGESPEAAAQRELFEESGVQRAVLYPICDYYGYDPWGHSNGRVFLADVQQLDSLPESEMAETQLFHDLPADLTYPAVSPLFFTEAQKHLHRLGIQ